MESYYLNNFEVKPKLSSEEALQKWRKLCGSVKNPKRRFRFTANLSKRYEAQAMRRTNQGKMYRSELCLQCLSLVLLIGLVPHLLCDARPLNPSMEVEGKKKQSLPSSTFEASVKERYVVNKGEIPTGGPPAMYSPPSHIGKHEMSSAGQRVHGGGYVPLGKGPVPPSAPNPITHGP